MSGNQSKAVKKHSPGPWSADYGGLVVNGAGKIICSVHRYVPGEISDDQNVLAAAPDLLAAAEAMVLAVNEAMTGCGHNLMDALLQAESAIAKARGEG